MGVEILLLHYAIEVGVASSRRSVSQGAVQKTVTRACILARFVRRTKKKERLLVVYEWEIHR